MRAKGSGENPVVLALKQINNIFDLVSSYEDTPDDDSEYVPVPSCNKDDFSDEYM